MTIAVMSHRHGLEALVDEGLVAALGLSNCSLAQVEEVLAVAKHKPVCNQVGPLVLVLVALGVGTINQ
jgi:diketogulonate reductase-like aldo/keto reductase